jgi:F-type H+-transporting ATPase subunit b
LRGLDGAEKIRLASALQSSAAPVLVRSAFELAAAQRATIENAVKETLAAATQVRFEQAEDLVGGIELTMQGQKIAWSIADYLASLDKSVNELLKAQLKAEASSSSKPQ